MWTPIVQLTQKPARMLRWMKMCGGTVAVLGLQIWIKAKATNKTKAIISKAMMRPLLHCRTVRSARFHGKGKGLTL